MLEMITENLNPALKNRGLHLCLRKLPIHLVYFCESLLVLFLSMYGNFFGGFVQILPDFVNRLGDRR